MCCKHLDEVMLTGNRMREQNLFVAVKKVLAWA